MLADEDSIIMSSPLFPANLGGRGPTPILDSLNFCEKLFAGMHKSLLIVRKISDKLHVFIGLLLSHCELHINLFLSLNLQNKLLAFNSSRLSSLQAAC